MSDLVLPDGVESRALERDAAEAILRSMLARERPKVADLEPGEYQEWVVKRLQLADALLRIALNLGSDAASVIPLGSVVQMKVLGKTKKHGPRIQIEVPEEVELRLLEEDPLDRDLLLLVEIDNRALRGGDEKRIVVPGAP